VRRQRDAVKELIVGAMLQQNVQFSDVECVVILSALAVLKIIIGARNQEARTKLLKRNDNGALFKP
jgi:hypothetical protein